MEEILFDVELDYWYHLDNKLINSKTSFEQYAESFLIKNNYENPRYIINKFDELKKSLPIVFGILIFETKVLLVKTTGRNYYEFPGGKANPREDVLDAAVREIKEEVGLNLDKKDAFKIDLNIEKELHSIRALAPERELHAFRWILKEMYDIKIPNKYEIIDTKWVEIKNIRKYIKNRSYGYLILKKILE